jgi:hypothetical protein
MRTFLLRTILAAVLAYAPDLLAQSIGDWCKNHYILRQACRPCPSVIPLGEPIAYVAQGTKMLAVGSERRRSAGNPWVWGPELRSLAIIRMDPLVESAEGIDLAWADCGFARIPIWGESDEARAVALQPDGKILVLGTTLDPTEDVIRDNDWLLEPHSYLAVIRLNGDGTLDRTFATGGRLVFRLGPEIHSEESDINSRPSVLEVLADGTIRVSTSDGRNHNYPVARIRPEGTIEWVAVKPALELHVAIEFVNDRGDRYVTSDPDEAVMFDLSDTWYRTGRAFVP